MLQWILSLALAAPQGPDAETRVVEYLRANVKPGQPVVVSRLYNEVFTTPEERAALNRLFNAFFKVPLFVAQQQRASGRPPTLAEIGEQLGFRIPGQAALLLTIMEADPRMPRFLERDAASGEIVKVDVEAILAHPRFGKSLERSITGWEGQQEPAFVAESYAGPGVSSEALAGKPHLVYFWFTNCPPCLKTSPLLVELHHAFAPRGFEIVAANADRVLELPFSDDDRRAYAAKLGIPFALVHLNAAMQEAYGAVSVFPTLFFIDRKGTIVRHLLNFQEKPVLEAATRLALQ